MTTFDVVALAKRINQRREEYNRLHPFKPVRITSALSRLVECDPDYRPSRRRSEGKHQRAVVNPSIRSLVAIAEALGTTVGDLLDEPRSLTPMERARLTMAARTLAQMLA